MSTVYFRVQEIFAKEETNLLATKSNPSSTCNTEPRFERLARPVMSLDNIIPFVANGKSAMSIMSDYTQDKEKLTSPPISPDSSLDYKALLSSAEAHSSCCAVQKSR